MGIVQSAHSRTDQEGEHDSKVSMDVDMTTALGAPEEGKLQSQPSAAREKSIETRMVRATQERQIEAGEVDIPESGKRPFVE